ncbi:MAG: hypothetical protein MZU97_11745 [Bacillus subtilis]|nr:hypothetical protein [Bacillus subtilis]
MDHRCRSKPSSYPVVARLSDRPAHFPADPLPREEGHRAALAQSLAIVFILAVGLVAGTFFFLIPLSDRRNQRTSSPTTGTRSSSTSRSTSATEFILGERPLRPDRRLSRTRPIS